MANYNKSEDTIQELVGKIVRIDSEGHKLPLFGELLEATQDGWLTIRRKDGSLAILSRKTILGIEPTRSQRVGP
jgi:flagellar basal body rod protein FlgF